MSIERRPVYTIEQQKQDVRRYSRHAAAYGGGAIVMGTLLATGLSLGGLVGLLTLLAVVGLAINVYRVFRLIHGGAEPRM